MPTVTLNHESISYLDAGHGQPILFIHSLGTHSAVFWPTLQRLTAQSRVIAMDLRGHGGTSARGGVSLEGITRDAVALLDHLGIARAAIGGLSMGGNVALHLWELFPERVAGLLLSDTFSRFPPGVGVARLADRAGQVIQKGMVTLGHDYVTATLQPSASAAAREAVAAAIAQVEAEHYVAATAACFLANYDHVLPTVNVPTLVLVGDKDAVTPLATAQGLQARIPGAELQVIAGAGHLAPLDNPDDFTDAVTAFLRTVEAKEAGGRE